VNPRGFYYKPAGATRQNPAQLSVQQQQQQQDLSSLSAVQPATLSTTAAAAALASAAYAVATTEDSTDETFPNVYPAAIPCPPDTWSNGLNFQSNCTPCPPDFKTDPLAPAGSADSPAACLAPPGAFLHPANFTVVPCEVGSYSDDYSNNTACISCEDAPGPGGQPLGPGIVTAGSGSNSSAACRVLEPGFALVDVKGLVILQPLETNQVGAA
jgi:hypothetical protein